MRQRTRRDLLRGVAVNGVVTGGGIVGSTTNSEAVVNDTSSDSQMDQYDSRHSGHAPDGRGPTADPRLLWQYATDNPISTSPAVVDRVAYVASGSSLYALDAHDGVEDWHFDTDEMVVKSPTVVGGTAYLATKAGTLYAVGTATGQMRWSTSIGDDPSSPVIVDGDIYITGGGRLHWLNTRGEEVDAVDLAGKETSAPAVGDGAVFVGTDEGTLYGFMNDWSGVQSSLTERWEVDTVINRVPTMTLVDETVYVTGSAPAEGNQGRVYALDTRTGQQRWSLTRTPWVTGSVAVTNDSVYVGYDNGDVLALDAANGTERWRFDANSSWSFLFWGPGVSGSPIVSENTLYIGSEDNNLYALDTETGEERWRYVTTDSIVATPTVINGVVYVGSEDGSVYAVTNPDVSPVSLAANDGTRTEASDRSSDGPSILGTVWNLLTSPVLLLGGFLSLLVLLAIGASADKTEEQLESTPVTTFTAEDVPDELRTRREQLKEKLSEFVEQNDLSRRAAGEINVPKPESFDDADSAQQAYEDLEERIVDWMDDWQDVMERRERLVPRIDRLRDQAGTSTTFSIDIPDCTNFRRLDAAENEVSKLETTVDDWEQVFETYRDSPPANGEFDFIMLPDEAFNVSDPASFDDPKHANEVYEQYEKFVAAVNRVDVALARLETRGSLDTDAVEALPIEIFTTTYSQSLPFDYSELAERIDKLASVFERVAEFKDRNGIDQAGVFVSTIVQTIATEGLPEAEVCVEYERVVDGVQKVTTFLDRVDHGHPSIDAAEWLDTANLALSESYSKVLNPVTARIERMGETLWTDTHLQSYSWGEFESLIGSLYRSSGYETTVTQGTADLGVDVWAETDDERVAIQVKQYKRGNTVGRETLQKLASTLAKGDADRVIVVTSSTFARTAEEYAADFGPEVELVDGDRLLGLLNESELPPPVED